MTFPAYFEYRFVLALLVMCIFGCSHEQVVTQAEIISLDAVDPRSYSLHMKNFVEVPKLPELTNSQMQFLVGGRMKQAAIGENAVRSSSFAELADSLLQSMSATPIKIKMSVEGGVALARSFDSMLALSAYCHLEEIFGFAKKVMPSTLVFPRPLTVLVYGEILGTNGSHKPAGEFDNALYVGSADAIFLLPLGKVEGLPLPMHAGVLAHEFHHRIFFHQVWNNPQFANLWSLFQSRYDLSEERINRRSRILLTAIDEGLADIFAVAFSGLPDFLNISLTQKGTKDLRNQRDLNGDFAKQTTYDSLLNDRFHHKAICGKAENFGNPRFNVYCLGTVIAKAIFEASSSDIDILRKQTLPLIIMSLTAIAEALNQEKAFDLDVFFERLAAVSKSHYPDLHVKFCDQIKLRFLSLATEEKIPSCKDNWKKS